MILLDGKKTAADIKEEIALQVAELVKKDNKKTLLNASTSGTFDMKVDFLKIQ